MSEKMLSLYDYLGRAAGSTLGKKVAEFAASKKVKHETRFVSNPKYTGEVMLYPETFLKKYFNKSSLERKVSELQENTLPF
jgi:hypothetical protein